MRQVIRFLMNILVSRVILNARGTIRKRAREFDESDTAVVDVSFSDPISSNTMSGVDWSPESIELPVRSQGTSLGEYTQGSSEERL